MNQSVKHIHTIQQAARTQEEGKHLRIYVVEGPGADDGLHLFIYFGFSLQVSSIQRKFESAIAIP